MLDFGKEFAKKVSPGQAIELLGDVGAGKTTFTRGLAEGLGVKESITSPSFTISKTYALPGGKTLSIMIFIVCQILVLCPKTYQKVLAIQIISSLSNGQIL